MPISLQKVPKTAMARKGCLLPARARYALSSASVGATSTASSRTPRSRPSLPKRSRKASTGSYAAQRAARKSRRGIQPRWSGCRNP
jgi:hypothetical protein